jgi:hypothetical protein
MRIQDAKPGDMLRDKDGDPWLVLPEGQAVNIWEARKSGPTWPEIGLSELSVDVEWIDGVYGPFTRLVPEVEPTNA